MLGYQRILGISVALEVYVYLDKATTKDCKNDKNRPDKMFTYEVELATEALLGLNNADIRFSCVGSGRLRRLSLVL